jgi:uncharacterized protein (UPF0218 family)
MRAELKSPLGELIVGDPAQTMMVLGEKLRKRPPLFAVVGDFVAKNVLNAQLEPDIIIVDNRTLREEVEPVAHGMNEVRVRNDAGTISDESQEVIHDSVTLKSRVALVVEGEEDLLVLPLLAEMPLGSVIAYGQPREGLVVVTVTGERRRWARGFMSRMEMR